MLSRIGYVGAASENSSTLWMKEMNVMFNNVKAHRGTLLWMISLDKYECGLELGAWGFHFHLPSIVFRPNLIATSAPVVESQTDLRHGQRCDSLKV